MYKTQRYDMVKYVNEAGLLAGSEATPAVGESLLLEPQVWESRNLPGIGLWEGPDKAACVL